MLPIKRSAGVAPEVNLRIMYSTKHASEECTLALKPRVDVIKCPKQGYMHQWSHKKDLCIPKIIGKKEKNPTLMWK